MVIRKKEKTKPKRCCIREKEENKTKISDYREGISNGSDRQHKNILFDDKSSCAGSQRLYLFEDPQATCLSLCIYCLNGTQKREEKRTPRENENDRRPRPYTADFEVLLSDGLIGTVSAQRRLEFMTNQGRETNAPKPASI